jgi:hypothetical protein
MKFRRDAFFITDERWFLCETSCRTSDSNLQTSISYSRIWTITKIKRVWMKQSIPQSPPKFQSWSHGPPYIKFCIQMILFTYLLTYVLTYSMGQSLSRVANRFSATWYYMKTNSTVQTMRKMKSRTNLNTLIMLTGIDGTFYQLLQINDNTFKSGRHLGI